MNKQIERANLLRKLHVKGDPLILFNIWDAGSAKAIQEAGAKVIATSSWSVAKAHGFDDGEEMPFDFALANLKRIIESVSLPVTIDLEAGYGHSTSEVERTVTKAIEAGAVGINFEDKIIQSKALYSIEEQCARIKAVRTAATRLSIPIFINARTDIFLEIDSADHNDKHLEEAIHRALAYAEFGASGFFTPGLRDPNSIQKLCALSPLPLNIMVMSDTPTLKELSEFGVARISYGPGPYFEAMKALKDAGHKAFS